MSKKDDRQLDLFAWADNRPIAQFYEFKKYLARAILADPDKYDPMVTPLPSAPGDVVALKRAMG